LRELSDEELIKRYREGDTACLDELIYRYKDKVRSKARCYFLMGGEQEDLAQEGMIGLFKAIRDYQPGKSSQFKTFANLCVSRQLASALKSSNRHKHIPLNSYISFYQNLNDELELKDVLGASELSPEQIVIDKEDADDLSASINARLSSLEKRVLYKYIQGLSYEQISKELLISKKTIDNALQRIKRKLSQK
jgi:RNA polymerase sporulation-specific sigma factor